MASKVFPITMPKWGIEMQQGTIAAWHVAPGAAVAKGQSMLEVETDKIVNSVEAPMDGTLRRILAETGAQADVGALIAVFADPQVPDAEVARFIENFKPADARFEPDYGEAAAQAPAPALGEAAPAGEGDAEARVSPIARRVAERLGIDLSQVKGTGRNGRISKEDVEAFAARSKGAVNAATRKPLSAMRQVIARRLLESTQGIPHYRLSLDVTCDALQALRKGIGQDITLNHCLIRATSLALVAHPALNSHLLGDEIVQFEHVDLSIAVATEGGLITPVLRQAESKSVQALAAELKALAARARAGTLKREEIAGGSFTVSNLGMYGIDRFDAIINPPQVAILAIGAASERLIVRDGAAAVASVLTLTLSADHRAIDGAAAAPFLATLKRLIEQPAGF